ncbi:hypothetical protein GOODEAATRI_024653 [Goodea atripinnis]|uniref:Uncharacterized protein n=1 Tax=Goodea atripinnis TaxID=208336 RepID=A0ABV0MKG2_9TELE
MSLTRIQSQLGLPSVSKGSTKVFSVFKGLAGFPSLRQLKHFCFCLQKLFCFLRGTKRTNFCQPQQLRRSDERFKERCFFSLSKNLLVSPILVAPYFLPKPSAVIYLSPAPQPGSADSFYSTQEDQCVHLQSPGWMHSLQIQGQLLRLF